MHRRDGPGIPVPAGGVRQALGRCLRAAGLAVALGLVAGPAPATAQPAVAVRGAGPLAAPAQATPLQPATVAAAPLAPSPATGPAPLTDSPVPAVPAPSVAPEAAGLMPVVLAGATAPVGLIGQARMWLDSRGMASAADVSAGTVPVQWQALPANSSFRMRHGEALWIRFDAGPVRPGELWLLELAYAPIDRITLYHQNHAGEWVGSSAGDRVAVSSRPIAFRHPLLPLVLSDLGPTRQLVRIESPHDFATPLRLLRQDMVLTVEAREMMLLGIYFGLLLLGLSVAGTLGIGRRDPVLELFAAKQGLAGLTAAALSGVASLYLWPEAPAWNDLTPTLFAYAIFACTALMIATALGTVPGISRVRRLLRAVAALGGAMVLLAAWVDPSLRIRILGAYALLATLLSILVCFAARSRGERHALLLAAALSPLLLAAVFPLMRASGVNLPSQLVQYAILIGTALEIPAMLLVLLRRNHERQMNEERLERLDRVDPATGLVAARVFVERGQQMIARSQRFGHQGAVLLIDIANADRIERDYNEFRPDELPLRVASRLVSAVRDVDVTARLSDRRFGIVVEGPVSPTEEAALGPRLVAACLMPFADKPEGWVAQVRVAYALVPLDGSEMSSVVARLSAVLASIPADSRKAVFTLSSAPATAGMPEAPARAAG